MSGKNPPAPEAAEMRLPAEPKPPAPAASMRLSLKPKEPHMPESYEDMEMELDFSPVLFSSLEKYLPSPVLSSGRDEKVEFMSAILLKYLPQRERERVQKHLEYRKKITSNYQQLEKRLFTSHPGSFIDLSFSKAVHEGKEESFRSIVSEPSPGVFTFKMFQPRFCEMLLSEVKHFQSWVLETRFRNMRPNTMNNHGAVLDDFGLEGTLSKLLEYFIKPMAKVFFPEVGGASLDSHHGFVVEYGENKDVDLGFHVDDSEVTLNVCLGTQFSGGDLFFRGTRCDKHVNTGTQQEEIFDYSHEAGQAVLHRGRHRHGARATTSGYRINLLMWCRSSNFREMKKYQTDFSSWCGECSREKKERQQAFIARTRMELLRNEGATTA